MKQIIKRVLAVMLALAMVIPGVYFGNSGQEEVKAAGTVSTDMLDIKVQVAVDDTDVIRVITSVDSLEYSKVGFELTTPSGTKTYETQTVYERIVSEVTDEEYEFSPKVVDTSAEYFVTAKFRATEGVDYTVKAFACAKGSTTKVYGPSRVVALGDANDNIINMMVGFATTANATYDVYDGSTKIGTAKVLADKNVRITLSSKKATDFPSATKFTFKNGSTSVGTEIYRNYYTKYTGEGTEDKTWYTVDTSATEFIVASSADLYGLSSYVNAGTNFSGKKVIQVRDIEVNKGTASATAWTPATGEMVYEWISIGNMTYGFSGLYDGDMNEISGVYETQKNNSADTQRMGLFGTLNWGGKIQNVKVVNSYYSFPSGLSNIGGVVGYCQGSLDTIYVGEDVFLQSVSGSTGGVVGMYSVTNTAHNNTLKNIWFAGTFTSNVSHIGGIVGRSYRGKVTLENCLFTGTVSGNQSVAGLVGSANGNKADSGSTANYNRTTIKNSISAGTVKSASTDKVGTVVGSVNQTDLKFVNVYSNENRVHTGSSAFVTTKYETGIGNYSSGSALITGVPVAFTTELNGTGAYLKTGFDFYTKENQEGAWAAVTGKTPVIKAFADEEVIDTLTGKRVSEAFYYNAYTKKDDVLAKQSGATFELATAADLNGFAAKSKSYYFKGDTVKLTADIDLNPGWKPVIEGNGTLTNATGVNDWVGIGQNGSGTGFYGVFDGQGYSISGMYHIGGSGMGGMFLRLNGTASAAKNFKLINSYFKAEATSASDLRDIASIVGYCQGRISDIYSNAIVVANTWDAGGLIGRLASSQTVENCWFDGELYVIGNITQGSQNASYGGIVGRIHGSATETYTFKNCLNSGKVVRTVGNVNKSAFVGGIIGGDFNTKSATVMQNCLNVGYVSDAGKYAGGLAGILRGVSTLEDCYTTNEGSDRSAYFFDGASMVDGSTYNDASYVVKKEDILLDAAKTGAPGLFEDGDVWAVDTESGDGRGTPMLAKFATWWQEEMFDDGVLKVLLVGNSFCYYHTDELYGMLAADGTKAIVANVYDSGCTMQEHVTFLNNNTKRYQYIAIEDGLKTSVSSQTMTQCLDAEDWDVISFQQHFDPSEAMDYATASGITVSYAKTMYDYLKANYPEARLLWQQTWAYQVGYIGHGGLTQEQKENQDAKYKVLDEAKQTLNHDNIRAVAKAVCRDNDVERVPNGDAWQIARADAAIGDILCDKSGTDLASDTHVSDNYHDGDVGGGQLINACGWYEVITGIDCRVNTFVPSYTLLAPIKNLKDAAHTAVANAMTETEDPLFGETVTVNGKGIVSNEADWVYDGMAKKATGTHNTNSVFYMNPLYFNETGTSMLLQTTITNVSNPIKDQPLAGLYITDGTNKGGFGVYSNLIKYGQWLDKSGPSLGYAVLTQWDTNPSIQFDVALKNGELYIYVNDVFVTKLAVNDVMFSGTSSGDLAFGLTMRSEKGVSTSLEFSNIEFTTDAEVVEDFLTDPLFADAVTVNGKSVSSNKADWVYDGLNKTATGTHTTTSVFKLNPIYLKETGSEMLLSTTITNNSATIKGEPMAGVYVTDGTNHGYFGLCSNGLVFGPWNEWVTERYAYAVLSQWGNKSVKLDVAYTNGSFIIYVDNLFFMELPLSTVLPNTAAGTELAFGLTMRTASNDYPAVMKFSDISFTTNHDDVWFFIMSMPR